MKRQIAALRAVAGLSTTGRGAGARRLGGRNRSRPSLLELEVRRVLSTIVVTSAAASGDGSLAAAVQEANQATTPSTIVFDSSLDGQTITPTQTVELSNTSEPITIDGSGVTGLSISGAQQGQVFKVDARVTATLTGLAITHGNGGGDGAVYDLGNLTLTECTLQGTSGAGIDITTTGSADVQGCSIDDFNQFGAGGVQNYGSADLVDDTFSGNTGADACVLFNTGTATLTDCTMTGNSTGFGSGGLYNEGTLKMYGGTISSNSGGDGGVFAHGGRTYLDGVAITGNASSNGGGIVVSNDAILYANGCSIATNTARGAGGGLYDAGTAILSDCTISGNSAGSQGGGVAVGPLANKAVLTMTDSTVSGNTSVSNGGGIFNNGTAELTDCTLANNNADQGTNGFSANGGGLDDSGTATLIFCTISGNTTSYEGGGIYDGGLGADTVTLTDTIVAGNTTTSSSSSATGAVDVVVNGGGSILTGTYNLIGTITTGFLSGGSNIVGVASPDLGRLANNGGATETMALEAGSPAIGAGVAVSGVTTDQRGDPLDTPTPDIGAFQVQQSQSPLAFSSLTSPTITYGASSVTLGGTISGGEGSPVGESVAVTLDGQTQPATIGSGGSFSTVFDVATLPAAATPYDVSFTYTTDGVYASATGNSTLTVNPATAAVSVSDAGGVYDDSGYAASVTVTGGGASGASLEGVSPTLSYYSGTYTSPMQVAGLTPMTAAPVGVGAYTAVASFPGSADYSAAAGLANFSITQATPTVFLGVGRTTFGGAPPSPSATIDGVGGQGGTTLEGVGLEFSYYAGTYTSATQLSGLTPLSGVPSAVGDYTVLASFPGSSDYAAAAGVADFGIAKATPQVSVSDAGGTFGGTIPGATDGIAGVDGTMGSSLEGVGLTLSYYAGTYTSPSQVAGLVAVDPMDAGPYTAVASFAGSTDYNASAAVANFSIAQATPTLAVSDAGGTFNGAADPAAATVAGVVAGVDATPAATLEGVATTLEYYAGSYTSPAQVAGLTPLAGAPSQAGTYTVLESFPGSADYAAASTVAGFSILKATPTVNVVDAGGTYSGSAFPAAATVVGVPGSGNPSLESVAPTLAYYAGTYTSAAQLDGVTQLDGAPSAAGSYTVLASFPGSTDYAPSSGLADFTIARATSQLKWSPLASIVFGTALTSAQLDATANVPGTLTYTPGAGTVLAAGTGQTIAVSFTPADPNDYTGAALAATIDVTPATPTVTVTAPGGVFDGSPHPAMAMVEGAGAGSEAPASSLEGVTPSVTYHAGTGTSGPALGGAPSAPGTYTVVASFPGSADYTAAQSSPVTFTITQAAQPVSVSIEGTPVTLGQPVTLVATVASGPAAPGGTITFLDGSTTLGTVPVGSSGAATLETTALPAGVTAITAAYSGDADYLPATSPAASVTVGQAATQVAIASHPVVRNKKVISLNVEVEPTSSVSAVPTGSVTFEETVKGKNHKTTVKVLSTVPLVDGSATLSFKPGNLPKNPIVCVYDGDASFLPGTSPSTTLAKAVTKSMARSPGGHRVGGGAIRRK